MSSSAEMDALTCSAVTSALAPAITTMRLAPLASTSMRAVPEMPSTCATAEPSMPSVSTTPRSQAPEASEPRAPIIDTGTPSRAAATAWLSPLPPACCSSVSPNTVSPESGIRARPITRSRLRLPTTTTRAPMPPVSRKAWQYASDQSTSAREGACGSVSTSAPAPSRPRSSTTSAWCSRRRVARMPSTPRDPAGRRVTQRRGWRVPARWWPRCWRRRASGRRLRASPARCTVSSSRMPTTHHCAPRSCGPTAVRSSRPGRSRAI